MILSLHLDVDIDTENLMETSDGRLDAVCDNRGGAGGVKNFKMTARFERMVLANMVCHPDDRPSLPSIHVAIDDFVAVQSDTTNDDDSTSNVTNDTRFYPFTAVWGGDPCRFYPKDAWSGPVCGAGCRVQTATNNRCQPWRP